MPSGALPIILMFAAGCYFLLLAYDTARANPGAYRVLQRRARSPKHVVLGMVEPGENYAGGMMHRTSPDGKTVIVRTCQITRDDLEGLYR